MEVHYEGNAPELPDNEPCKACYGPVGMDDVAMATVSDGLKDKGEGECWKLCFHPDTPFHVLRDTVAVAEGLEILRVEISEALDRYAVHDFIPGCECIVWCYDLDIDPLFHEMPSLLEDKGAGDITFMERKGCCEDADVHK